MGEERWSSAGEPPAFPFGRSVTRILFDGTPIELGWDPEGVMVRATRDHVTVLLVPRDLRHTEVAPLAVLLTLAGVLGVLILVYHAIRRLFRPIETIRAGIARIGAGDLEHRIPYPPTR